MQHRIAGAADALHCHRRHGLPASACTDLERSLAVTTRSAWIPLTGFKTDDSLGGTFVRSGTTFDGTSFTTRRKGYYLLAFNLRVDGMSRSWFQAAVTLNGSTSLPTQGMMSLRGSTNYDHWSFSTSGVVQAAANTKYGLSIQSATDTSYTIHSFSGFTGFELFPLEGVYALPSSDTVIKNTNYARLGNWKTNDVQSFLLEGTFNGATGDYTVKESGIFLLSFNVRIEKVASQSGSFVRALIDINNKNEINAGLHSIQGKARLGYELCYPEQLS